MTFAELQHASQLADSAIQGPWRTQHYDMDSTPVDIVLDANEMWVADFGNDPKSAAFVAAARSIVPQLIGEVIKLRSALLDIQTTSSSSMPYPAAMSHISNLLEELDLR